MSLSYYLEDFFFQEWKICHLYRALEPFSNTSSKTFPALNFSGRETLLALELLNTSGPEVLGQVRPRDKFSPETSPASKCLDKSGLEKNSALRQVQSWEVSLEFTWSPLKQIIQAICKQTLNCKYWSIIFLKKCIGAGNVSRPDLSWLVSVPDMSQGSWADLSWLVLEPDMSQGWQCLRTKLVSRFRARDFQGRKCLASGSVQKFRAGSVSWPDLVCGQKCLGP